jgi:hypothetical protein
MAQPARDPLRWHVYGGWSGLDGRASDLLKSGWDLGFGVIWSPMPQRQNLGLRFDLSYDWWDVKVGNLPGDINRIDSGNANLWALKTGLHGETSGRTRFYGGVGIGGYSLYGDVRQTVLIPGWICDPFWPYYCYPAQVPAQSILASEKTTKFGYYANLGVAWEMGGGEGFLETTYNWVQTKETFKNFPIVLGYRW